MNILISNLSQTPIYEQIQNQIGELILSGKISPGDQLPSIRLMSKDLKVGIVTVKRAYEELEKEGLVVNLQGRGCFVQEIDIHKIKAQYLKSLREQLQKIKVFCNNSGISDEELKAELNMVLGEKKDE